MIHTGEKPFECSLCHKHFREKSNYNYHIKRHFNNKQPFVKKKFVSKKFINHLINNDNNNGNISINKNTEKSACFEKTNKISLFEKDNNKNLIIKQKTINFLITENLPFERREMNPNFPKENETLFIKEKIINKNLIKDNNILIDNVKIENYLVSLNESKLSPLINEQNEKFIDKINNLSINNEQNFNNDNINNFNENINYNNYNKNIAFFLNDIGQENDNQKAENEQNQINMEANCFEQGNINSYFYESLPLYNLEEFMKSSYYI